MSTRFIIKRLLCTDSCVLTTGKIILSDKDIKSLIEKGYCTRRVRKELKKLVKNV